MSSATIVETVVDEDFELHQLVVQNLRKALNDHVGHFEVINGAIVEFAESNEAKLIKIRID